jgi:hypothetical protein
LQNIFGKGILCQNSLLKNKKSPEKPEKENKNKTVQNRHNYPPDKRVLNIVLLSYLVIVKFG